MVRHPADERPRPVADHRLGLRAAPQADQRAVARGGVDRAAGPWHTVSGGDEASVNLAHVVAAVEFIAVDMADLPSAKDCLYAH